MKIMQIGRRDSFSTYETWDVRIPWHPSQRLHRRRNQLWPRGSHYITKRLSLILAASKLLCSVEHYDRDAMTKLIIRCLAIIGWCRRNES